VHSAVVITWWHTDVFDGIWLAHIVILVVIVVVRRAFQWSATVPSQFLAFTSAVLKPNFDLELNISISTVYLCIAIFGTLSPFVWLALQARLGAPEMDCRQ
jgi:hypothetical protein